jgi:hypothetical protein
MFRIKNLKLRQWLAMAFTMAAVAVFGVFVVPAAAQATEGTSTCTPSPGTPPTEGTPAVTHDEYQRYSWTLAGKNAGDGPGDSTPITNPGDWQANTTNYEGAGHGTDPIGVAFQEGTPGHGDWFFWTKTTVIDKPAVPGTPGTPPVICPTPTPTPTPTTTTPPPPAVAVTQQCVADGNQPTVHVTGPAGGYAIALFHGSTVGSPADSINGDAFEKSYAPWSLNLTTELGFKPVTGEVYTVALEDQSLTQVYDSATFTSETCAVTTPPATGGTTPQPPQSAPAPAQPAAPLNPTAVPHNGGVGDTVSSVNARLGGGLVATGVLLAVALVLFVAPKLRRQRA